MSFESLGARLERKRGCLIHLRQSPVCHFTFQCLSRISGLDCFRRFRRFAAAASAKATEETARARHLNRQRHRQHLCPAIPIVFCGRSAEMAFSGTTCRRLGACLTAP